MTETLSDKRESIDLIQEILNVEWVYLEEDVKEFIKKDWVLTNHFLWDLFRKWEIDEDVIEKEITKLKEKKDKLVGDKLIEKPRGESE